MEQPCTAGQYLHAETPPGGSGPCWPHLKAATVVETFVPCTQGDLPPESAEFLMKEGLPLLLCGTAHTTADVACALQWREIY